MFFFDFFFDKYQKLNDLNSKNRRLFLYPDPPKALMYGPHLCVCVQGMMLIPGGKRRFPSLITGLSFHVKTWYTWFGSWWTSDEVTVTYILPSTRLSFPSTLLPCVCPVSYSVLHRHSHPHPCPSWLIGFLSPPPWTPFPVSPASFEPPPFVRSPPSSSFFPSILRLTSPRPHVTFPRYTFLVSLNMGLYIHWSPYPRVIPSPQPNSPPSSTPTTSDHHRHVSFFDTWVWISGPPPIPMTT